MKKTTIILATTLIILILIFLAPFIISYTNEYSYTKAICDEKNYCEDYIIECKGKNLLKFTPTGLSIQQNENWVDIRENKELCE